MENIIIKTGKNPGNISTIMAGTHGNEICGIQAFENIIPNLEIEHGTVFFILGNPKAIAENVRYTEYNLNRAFKDISEYSKAELKNYELQRAQEIKKYLDKSSALLDIHSAKKKTEPFIFCEEKSISTAQELSSKFLKIVLGINAVEPGGTDGYMANMGKIGICVECGQHNDKSAITLAEQSIHNFLKNRGHIQKSNNENRADKPIINLEYSYYTKTNSFILERNFSDFEHLEKGTLVGKDSGKSIYTPFSGYIVFARNCNKKNLEGFLLGKDYIKHD